MIQIHLIDNNWALFTITNIVYKETIPTKNIVNKIF